MSARMQRPPGDVLCLWDASPTARNAAWRAALVARDWGVSLRLLHAASVAGSPDDEALHRLAHGIEDHVGVDVHLEAAQGEPLRACVQAARRAALVVIGSRRVNPLREWVLGTQAERLLRMSPAPVLVVKREARAGYRRMLVPLDLQADGDGALQLAASVARAPLVEVFHALSPRDELTMRVADAPEAALRAERRQRIERSHAVLQACIDASTLARAVPGVAFGDAASLVVSRANAMRADVVVIGKRRRGLLADFFLGGVTQRVLAQVQSDVLVLHRRAADPATARSAPERPRPALPQHR